jgi:hypothetical protein
MKRKLSLTTSVVSELKKGACQANTPLWLTVWTNGSPQKGQIQRDKN